MAIGNRSGGPKTAQGKAKSSKNALKLGATTMNIANSEEQKMVDEYTQELTSFYKPQSPLETLQIQRIAICRAKLARLYHVEQLRLQLAQKNIESDPEQIFQQMNIRDGLVRSMALEGLRHGVMTLPCDLSFAELDGIVDEADQFQGTLKSERDLEKSFPKLVKFLREHSSREFSQSTSLLERFEIVVSKIYKAMRQDILLGSVVDQLEELADAVKNHPGPPIFDSDGWSTIAGLMNPPKYPHYPEEISQLQTLLLVFARLKSALKDAQILMERYQEARTLLIQSALLPQSEADLLMRYQTTLERRLSSYLGELLELQRCR